MMGKNLMISNLLPTIVAQVTPVRGGSGGGQRGSSGDQVGDQGGAPEPVVEQNVHDDQGGDGGDAGLAEEGMAGLSLRRANNGYRQGCTYKDFKNYGPYEYNGKGGETVYVRWIEKMEVVISRSNCTYDQRINYVTGSLVGDALSWWNSEVETRGKE